MRLARAVAFALIASAILVVPGYSELGSRAPRYLPNWHMFSGKALNLVEVRFETEGPNGTRVPLDHLARLGYRDARDAPKHVRTLERARDAFRVAQQLCRVHKGPVYMRLRDATRDGFRVLEDGTHDVCSMRPPGKT